MARVPQETTAANQPPLAPPHRVMWLIAGAVLLAASGLCAFYARSASAPDSLKVDTQARDLGTLRQGVTRTTVFRLENPSSASIELRRILSNCGCTVTEIEKRMLDPGESLPLHVHFETGTSRGPTESQIRVYYRLAAESAVKLLTLQVRAEVTPDYHFSPARGEFDAKSATVEFKLWPGAQPELEVRNAYCTHRAFRSAIVEPNGNEQTWRIRVTYDRNQDADGSAEGTLVIETASESQRFCVIHLSAPTVQAITHTPEQRRSKT